jgi:hypothetical protein
MRISRSRLRAITIGLILISASILVVLNVFLKPQHYKAHVSPPTVKPNSLDSPASISADRNALSSRRADASHLDGGIALREQPAAETTSRSGELVTPVAWAIVSLYGKGTLRSDFEIAHGGLASALIQADPPVDPTTFTAIGQQRMADSFAGKRLKFSAFLKTKGALAGGYLWVRADDNSGLAVALDNRGSCHIAPTTDWTDCDVIIDIPSNAGSVTYGALLYGAGYLWIDDAQIEITDEGARLTGPTSPAGLGTTQHDVTNPLRAPTNLDFEDTMTSN